MARGNPLANSVIAISVSDSPDLGLLGMSDAHLRDATAELSRHLLAAGARVAYGGDLREGGFTEILFELVARHRRDTDEGDKQTSVVSYLAWPVHLPRPGYDLRRYQEELAGMATLLVLDRDGKPIAAAERLAMQSRKPTPEEWSEGLSAMRRTMVSDTTARIVAGGRVEGFQGVMPGIAEEALLAIRAGQAVFILGGFGGCARDIAETLGLIEERGIPHRQWVGQSAFGQVAPAQLNNGLTADENATLARTPHVDQAIALVLRGLLRSRGHLY